ncbi:hypothetical protein [Thalassobacillus sp. CUG 92003]|uniref:hypothetical protein n=1 Tax=Thalassobacillus sp. CUG 92003 TaxID=2736641 RepID=UPI0015E7A879|nr:hypothetical protein [Thalassobacillus sp. CUG 92003]
MHKRNVQWIPMVASIGIGAATYSMMTGRGGQLQHMLPQAMQNMTNQMPGQNNQMNS